MPGTITYLITEILKNFHYQLVGQVFIYEKFQQRGVEPSYNFRILSQLHKYAKKNAKSNIKGFSFQKKFYKSSDKRLILKMHKKHACGIQTSKIEWNFASQSAHVTTVSFVIYEYVLYFEFVKLDHRENDSAIK